MRKSIVFVSAALTAFVMAMLAGVVWAYRGIRTTVPAAAVQQNAVTLDLPSTPSVLSVSVNQVAVVSPQDAASIAAKFLNRTDAYSVEIVPLDGANVYKVTFKSGDILYVSLSGQVLSFVQAATPMPQTFVSQPSTSGHHGGGDGGGGGDDGGGD